MKEIFSLKTRIYQYFCFTDFSDKRLVISQSRILMKRNKSGREVGFAPITALLSSRLMATSMLPLFFLLMFTALVLPSIANAHRGARNEVDTCRFSVGDEVVHFTAYTPSVSGGKGYCQIIPSLGLTHLVFDYEGKKLRDTTVEFEITKEPEGTRVFYQKPEKIKKGSVDAKVDFSKFGASNYLAHVTVLYQGEKLDSHLPFSVGMESDESSFPTMVKVLLFLVVVIVAIMIWASRRKKN
jgi:hypothetical protein